MILRCFRREATQNRPLMGTTARAQGVLTGALSRFLPVLAFAVTMLLSQGLVAGPALAVDWVVNAANPNTGTIPASATANFDISVANSELDVAPPTTLTVQIPAGLTYTGTAPGGTITGCTASPPSGAGPATVNCNVPSVTTGSPATLTLLTRTTATGGYFEIGVSVPLTAGGVTDTQPGNNGPIMSGVTVTAGSDLALSITRGGTTSSGGNMSFTFAVRNNGPLSVSNIVMRFPAPDLSSIVPAANCTLSGTEYVCTLAGPVPAGTTATAGSMTGLIRAEAGTVITATGRITASTPPDPGFTMPNDPTAANNTASLSATVTGGSDMRMTKSVTPGSASTVYLGDAVTFTLMAGYTGMTQPGFRVTDTVPANFRIEGTPTGTGWTCSVAGQLVTCERGPSINVSTGSDNFPAITINTTAITTGGSINNRYDRRLCAAFGGNAPSRSQRL